MRDDILKRIREAAAEGRVVKADRDIIAALEAEVRRVLRAVADAIGNPNIADAWVSNLSSISDFLDWEDESVRQRQVTAIEKTLGIPLPDRGRVLVYEVALRLAEPTLRS